MEIRPALAKDLPAICAIYNEAIVARSATCDEDVKSLEDRTLWFSQFDERYPIFVVEVLGKVAGYGCLFKYSAKSGYRFAVENSVYVAQEFQGRGLGKALLSHLISTARQLGYVYMEARVFAHNPKSLELHKKAGFEVVGVQKKIANLDGNWRDNVILSLDLSTD